MSEVDLDRTIFIVIGASLRGEEMDRPLGYRLAEETRRLLGEDSDWRAIVISDVLYINNESLATCPTISVGGPGVNHLSAMLYRELAGVLSVDNVLLIQMDIELDDLRCCLWGMNHEQTVQALDLFIQRGYLERFVRGATTSSL